MHLRRASLGFAVLLLITGCQPGATPAPTPGRPAAATSPSPRPARAAASVVPSPSPATPLSTSLTGEFALSANTDDHTLSVVPIGLARADPPVQLDFAPQSVATWGNTSWAVAADGSAGGHTVSRLDLTSHQPATDVDVGGPVRAFSPGGGDSGPLVLVSDSDNTLRTLDPSTGSLGESVPLGTGPHTVAFAQASASAPAQIFVSNQGDGSVSVLDGAGTSVQGTLNVGGQPIGIAVTPTGHLWIADGAADDVYAFDPSSGQADPPIDVGAGLVSLTATPDGHYLVLASSDPQHALYSVDLFKAQLGQTTMAVSSLALPSGVLAVATGAEVTLAYATTGDDKLVYWDLVNNAISESVDVGKHPTGLALGLLMPNNAIAPAALVGGGTVGSTTSGGGTTGGGATGGTTAAAAPTSSPAGGASVASTGGTGGAPNASTSSAPASTTSSASSGAASTSAAAPAPAPAISSSSNTTTGINASSTSANSSVAPPAPAGGSATTGGNSPGISTIGSISNQGVGGQPSTSSAGGAAGASTTGGTTGATTTGVAADTTTGTSPNSVSGGSLGAGGAPGGGAPSSGGGVNSNPGPTPTAPRPTASPTPSRAPASTPVPSPAANRRP